MEQLILLEQSGELNFVRRWQLRRALAANAELKTFRDDVHQISALSRGAGPCGDFNPSVLGEIRKAAAEQQQYNQPHSSLSAAWLRPAIALAAMLVAIGGIAIVNQYRPPVGTKVASLLHHKSAKWDDNIDTELSNVSNLLTTNFETANEIASLDANSMARELLSLENSGQ
jgi:hypothetical protein